MKIWIDIKNSHEPGFFRAIMNHFEEHNYIVTTREYAEINDLLTRFGIEYSTFGRHYKGSNIKRGMMLLLRTIHLLTRLPPFEVALHHGSISSTHVSKLRRRTNICFSDNDISAGMRNIYKDLDYLIVPEAISEESMRDQGAKNARIIRFNGYKEDLYIADFEPDPEFLNELPFDEFVTVRAESIHAHYVPKDVKSIVPALLKRFRRENINVLFLPRYESDNTYIKGYENVYVPERALHGLDVVYHSNAILTGAGTFSREAACMGVPAISFFPGEKILAVDQKMIAEGWVFHSRDPDHILDFLLKAKKRCVDLERSKKVQAEVFHHLKSILHKISTEKTH
jgi:uncharacterized protein